MTKLYLVRHGETVANAAQILQGWQGGELNETGKAQAREVAEKMKDTEIDAFVASDLHRAIQTCTIIAAAHGVKPEDIRTGDDLAKLAGTGNWLAGARHSGGISEDELLAWANGLK